MVILGARGHALEIMDVLLYNNDQKNFCFFDDVSPVIPEKISALAPVIRSQEELVDYLQNNPDFALGTGNPFIRKKLAGLGIALGGRLVSVISKSAYVSSLHAGLGSGLNIMHRAVIHPDVSIGEGTLINSGAIVHHESRIGVYSEICPGAVITGNVHIGDYTMIGSGAVILPGIKIGNNVKVGAGAVVLHNIDDGTTVAGNPARIIKQPAA